MIKRILLSGFLLMIVAGCSSPPPRSLPTTDPCLALHTIGLPQCRPPDYQPATLIVPTPGYGKAMQKEVTHRLQEIHSLLAQEPLTQGALYKATTSISVQAVPTSDEYKDWQLMMLLMELQPVTPVENRPYINHIESWLQEFERLGPQVPVSENEAVDSKTVKKARKLFKQIEKEWILLLEHSD